MHPWQVGDHVWARYYSMASNGYVAEHLGRVVGVGPAGFTVRLVKPDQKGARTARYGHSTDGLWPSKEAAEAYLAAHPFNTGRVERETKD